MASFKVLIFSCNCKHSDFFFSFFLFQFVQWEFCEINNSKALTNVKSPEKLGHPQHVTVKLVQTGPLTIPVLKCICQKWLLLWTNCASLLSALSCLMVRPVFSDGSLRGFCLFVSSFLCSFFGNKWIKRLYPSQLITV